jgi:hypothetical protein
MNIRAFIQLMVISVALCALAFPLCGPQRARAQTGGTHEGITVVGTIVYTERTATYVLKGKKPPEEFMIYNPDPTVLKPLVENRTQVTVEGHTQYGVDYLVIHKINGTPYPSAPMPEQK